MTSPKRVLMLGLDAAEADVIQQLIRNSKLPTLRHLMTSGVFHRMTSPADHYAGGVWPTFYTGQSVPWHGIFHNKLWRPEKMRAEVPTDTWIPTPPLWESPTYQHLPMCLVDIPMLVTPSRLDSVTYLGGWGTHDLIGQGSWPTNLWADLEGRYGPPEMPNEHFGKQTNRALADLHTALLRTTDQLRDISTDLLRNQPWQFACIVFGAIHRAGHYLWDKSQVTDLISYRKDYHVVPDELIDIYAKADAAISSILTHVPDDTLVVIFALHGMGPNPGWSDLLPDILAKICKLVPGGSPRQGLLYTLKRKVPFAWVRPILRRMPSSLTQRLVPVWSQGMFDWDKTRWFPVPMDEAGYLRINLRGREAKGSVEPGVEYQTVCREMESLVAGLRNAETGEAIVGEVVRAYEAADLKATYRALVPDLIFRWKGCSATNTKRLISTEIPNFVYEVPKRLPSGRSGNHTSNAWLIACGEGAQSGTFDSVESISDLLPTVLKLLTNEPASST